MWSLVTNSFHIFEELEESGRISGVIPINNSHAAIQGVHVILCHHVMVCVCYVCMRVQGVGLDIVQRGERWKLQYKLRDFVLREQPFSLLACGPRLFLTNSFIGNRTPDPCSLLPPFILRCFLFPFATISPLPLFPCTQRVFKKMAQVAVVLYTVHIGMKMWKQQEKEEGNGMQQCRRSVLFSNFMRSHAHVHTHCPPGSSSRVG